MNYELAKELKEAGFLQGGEGDYSQGEPDAFLGEPYKSRNVYYPTLEELIEACGDGIEELKAIRNDLVGWKWEAHTDSYCMVGQTPNEAVSRLWLTLNKKS